MVVTFSHKHLVDRIECIVLLLCGCSIEALSWSFPLVNFVVSKPNASLLVSVIVDLTIMFLFDTAL